jgi:hypothetical protein
MFSKSMYSLVKNVISMHVIKLLKFDCMMRVIFIHSTITIQVFYYYYVFINLAEYSRIKVIVSAIKMRTLKEEKLSDSPAITSDYIPYTIDEIRWEYTLSSYDKCKFSIF